MAWQQQLDSCVLEKKGHATYRIVVVDKRKPRNSAYIEAIGTYDPHQTTTPAVQIKKENSLTGKDKVQNFQMVLQSFLRERLESTSYNPHKTSSSVFI